MYGLLECCFGCWAVNWMAYGRILMGLKFGLKGNKRVKNEIIEKGNKEKKSCIMSWGYLCIDFDYITIYSLENIHL